MPTVTTKETSTENFILAFGAKSKGGQIFQMLDQTDVMVVYIIMEATNTAIATCSQFLNLFVN